MKDELTTQLRMYPVCSCGCIIKGLTLTEDIEKTNGIKVKVVRISPSNCPRCKKKITEVVGKVKDEDSINFTY